MLPLGSMPTAINQLKIMKKFNLFACVIVALMAFSVKASAQTPNSYFVGKWDILIKGTPNGDVHMMIALADSAGAVKGTYEDMETKKQTPFDKIEKKDNGVVLYFRAQGYDLNLPLEKKDEDHVAGSLMGMFESTGVRVKP